MIYSMRNVRYSRANYCSQDRLTDGVDFSNLTSILVD